MPLRLAHLAAAALLPTLAASGPAQLHSPQVTLHRKPHPADYTWLFPYAQPAPTGNPASLLNDPRFSTLLTQQFTATQTFWGSGGPVATTVPIFFQGAPGRVVLDDNRYLSFDGCAKDLCANRGLLFADLGTPNPLFVFAASDWISDNKTIDERDATYTLWVFPNRVLDPKHLPPALIRSVTRWTSTPAFGDTAAHNITRVFLVDPDNTPHPLGPATIGAHNTLPPETTNTTEVPS